MAKLSPKTISSLKKKPFVVTVDVNHLEFTLEFRQKMYDAWKINPSHRAIRQFLEEAKVDTSELSVWIKQFHNRFRVGRPKRGKKSEKKINSQRDSDEQVLLKSGIFVRCNNGIGLAPEIEKDLYEKFPEQSVKEGLEKLGLSEDIVGKTRISYISLQFRKYRESDSMDTEPGTKKTGIQQEGTPNEEFQNSERMESGSASADQEIERIPYDANPFVLKHTSQALLLTDSFYNDAMVLREKPIKEILAIFGICAADLSLGNLKRISGKLAGWVQTNTEEAVSLPTEAHVLVLRRKAQILEQMVEEGFHEIKIAYRKASGPLHKQVCRIIAGIAEEPDTQYSVRELLQRCGIAKSAYYEHLRDENYGVYDQIRRDQDAEDAMLIREIAAYKGFEKGSRQIYMLLRRLKGRTIGLRRIRRLMKEHHMECTIRGANLNRRAMQEMLNQRVKPNLLRRKFRMFRPNHVRVTDVTYLTYNEKNRAYGSALMDPVTGRLIAFHISDRNDTALALETLRQGDAYPCIDGGIFHSDQGILYLTEEYQAEVLERGGRQSMSKRGNSQDNAPQESFFGHFKDECSLESCRTLEELRRKVADYMEYYNHERGQWSRNQMTPVEYEAWLTAKSDEEFAQYLAEEEEKYQAMKERARKLVIARARTLGV